MEEACVGSEAEVQAESLFAATLNTLYDGISQAEIMQSTIMAARARIEEEPAYTFVAARLLLGQLRQEATG